ncbi:DUF4422 domain-containing protein [Pelosinus sp. sgz500959]|uniref:DUF4422 domain-containing protein n=1 Tax=Pelosinus sp. sgz500959 TaxID=3242472 RepID=UPI00366D1C5B
MKSTFYIACHKPYWTPVHPDYQVLHVGATTSDTKLPGFRDDEGESISEKNSNYCELTGLFWIWKNDRTSDVIGLCHYRRYFAFQEPGRGIFPGSREIIAGRDFTSYLDKMINPAKLDLYLSKYDMILPTPRCFPIGIEEYYQENHIPEDWNIMKEVLNLLFPEYSSSMEKVFADKWFYPYNMFIMHRKIFDEYMPWLFSILDEVEKRINISQDIYQRRVFGFLAERLLNVYVYHHSFKVKEIPIIFIDEQQESLKYKKKLFKFILRDIRRW